MKLELKHLSPYLPYGLKLRGHTHGEIVEMSEVNENNVNVKDRGFQYGWWADMFDVSPILRPLSDLKDEILCKYYVYYCSEKGLMVKAKNELYTTLVDLNYFYKNHFDVFGLIEKGLAIDINTLD